MGMQPRTTRSSRTAGARLRILAVAGLTLLIVACGARSPVDKAQSCLNCGVELPVE